MKRINYNDTSCTLRLEYPSTWVTPTGVDIAIYDRSGTAMLAATAATLGFAATTISAAASAGDTTITLAADKSLESGDVVWISKTGDRTEEVTVLSYVSATKVTTLKRRLEFDHTSGAAVSARWCTYALDTTTTSTFENTRECTIEWDPDTDDLPFVEYARVQKQEIASSDLKRFFLAQYPTRYTAIQTRWADFEEMAIERLRVDLLMYNRHLDDLIETALVQPLLIELIALLSVMGGGDNMESEIKVSQEAYYSRLEKLINQPAFWDSDQDKILDASDWDILAPRTFERRF